MVANTATNTTTAAAKATVARLRPLIELSWHIDRNNEDRADPSPH